MSHVRLNITDRNQTISGEVHGFFGDALVASLAAEPETVEELALALARFIKPHSDLSPFHGFAKRENLEPDDAGVLVIDLTARVVAVDSSYSSPSVKGGVRVQSDFADTEDVIVPYRLSDDWLFVYSIPEYQGVCLERREKRLASKPFDARGVLYGRALVEFIAKECSEARDSNNEDLFTRIHVKWLMTARDDLQGKTPREVLLEKQDSIGWDLQSRAMQWSFTNECPPPLSLDSNAYKHAGFGTHEIVVYYDMVRHLLSECFGQARTGFSLDEEIERLEKIKNIWLEAPNYDLFSASPAQVIESERRRVNEIMSAKDVLIDEDCPVCVAMSEDFDTPMFWHLDGSGMDYRFEFSFHKTLEEWEEEQREWGASKHEIEEERKAGTDDKPFDDSLIDFKPRRD